MKNTLIVLSVALLGQTAIAQAAQSTIDMTPYFQPMMTGCTLPNTDAAIPEKYHDVIVGVVGENYSDGESLLMLTTYSLDGATVFGYPLEKFEYAEESGWANLKLYFMDSKFMVLRPQFQLPVNQDSTAKFSVKVNNNLGYKVTGLGVTTLEFNSEENSIACTLATAE